jgi:hypothetical protein
MSSVQPRCRHVDLGNLGSVIVLQQYKYSLFLSMFLKTFRSLWRRIFMDHEPVEDVFVTGCFQDKNEELPVSTWTGLLTRSDSKQVHEDCYISSIAIYKDCRSPYHEHIQFTVTMYNSYGYSQSQKFNTHRFMEEMGEIGRNSVETSSISTTTSVSHSAEMSPPTLQGSTNVSGNLSLGLVAFPARDVVRRADSPREKCLCNCGNGRGTGKGKGKVVDHNRYEVEIEPYKLRLVPFALILKSVSSYEPYRLLRTQCYWYAYTVLRLALLHSGSKETVEGPALPESLAKDAELASQEDNFKDNFKLPRAIGKYSGIPISKAHSVENVIQIFEAELDRYKGSTYWVCCLILILF